MIRVDTLGQTHEHTPPDQCTGVPLIMNDKPLTPLLGLFWMHLGLAAAA